MFKPLSIFLALRYVRSRQGNGFSSFISASSTIGIALGVMVLIVVLSAMNGFEKALASKLLSVVPHGEFTSVNAPITNWQKTVSDILKSKDVVAAAPVINMSGMMQYKSDVKGVEIKGVDVKLETQVSTISDYVVSGSWSDLSNENSVVIGAGIAKKLRLHVGDSVQALLPQHQRSQQSNSSASLSSNNIKQRFPMPLTKQLTVVGIFKFGGMIDDVNAYMSIDQAADFMGYEANAVEGIRMKVSDVFSAPRIIRDTAYTLDHYVYISDWTHEQGHLFNDIQLVRMVMYIVLVIVIAVASFNIVSTLIMAVNDKKSDIAILKTMGASSGVIMTSFMMQGLMNGVLGTIIGAVSGIYLATNLTTIVAAVEDALGVKFLSADVYFIDFLPSYLHYPDVYITVITALILSLLATLYPSWSATKIEPAQVLGQS
jgi:lipoprotein-releasing system permease protein